MADENEKKRISFEFYKESDEKLIQAAFFEGGKKGKIKYHLPVQHHRYSSEALRQMVISVSTSLASILQGIRSVSGVKVLQQGMGTTLAMIGAHGRGSPGPELCDLKIEMREEDERRMREG